MGRFKKKEKITLEKQLEEFSKVGIRLNPGITIDHLLLPFSREKYETEPYEMLLAIMGDETEDDNPKRISDNLWHLDTECIYGNGSYVNIALNMKALAGKYLPIEDIQDHVDSRSEIAWLSFKLDGVQYKWDFQVKTDGVDPKVFTEFQKLLSKKTNNTIKYILFEGGGQDCLIGCMSEEQIRAFKKMTSLEVTSHFE